MAQQYLLPCECGKALPVSVAQAGRAIACDCGREHKVPTLAGLRQLNPVEIVPGKGDSAAPWSPLRGGIFVVGVILALAGLTLGGYSSYILREIDLTAIEKFVQHTESHDMETVDRLSPYDALALWEQIKAQGPGQAGSGLNVRARQVYDLWRWRAVAGFVAAAVGIVMAGGTLVRVGSGTKAF